MKKMLQTGFRCSYRNRRFAIAVQKGTGAKVVGLDLSQQMLNVGIDKIKK
jgi:hypothetical protein